MAEAITPPSDARYGDGAPFDEITYLEAKLILKPDRFTAVKDFRAFGKIVKKTAKQTGVGFAPAKVDVPEVREITFFDTPTFDFYNNAFILRRRITFKDGFAVGDPEIVFKFRHPEEAAATAVDVRPMGVASHRIKFKAEALPLKDRVGGYRPLLPVRAEGMGRPPREAGRHEEGAGGVRRGIDPCPASPRMLAVILQCIWTDGTVFEWKNVKSAA